MSEHEVRAECSSCSGTGIYCGFAEPKGYGVICNTCGGTGCRIISYKLFAGRNPKPGVEKVIIGHSLGWAVEKDRMKTAIPIKEFYDKVKP